MEPDMGTQKQLSQELHSKKGLALGPTQFGRREERWDTCGLVHRAGVNVASTLLRPHTPLKGC